MRLMFIRLRLMATVCVLIGKAIADEPPQLPTPPTALVAFTDRLEQHLAVFPLMQNQWEDIFFH